MVWGVGGLCGGGSSAGADTSAQGRAPDIREETFSSHASVEVVRDSRQTEVSKQIIFTSVEVSGHVTAPPAFSF